MNASDPWSLGVHLAALAIPALLGVTALVRPRWAEVACALALAMTLGIVLALATRIVRAGGSAVGVRLDVVTCAMLLLVCGIGYVIARYSRTYLQGEPRLDTYDRWVLLTLGAVTSLVIASNLLVIAAAWTATSIALHQLLTFYPDRSAALVAAHKKFLVSRLADVCFWSCLVLVRASVGSLDLDRISGWAVAHPDLTPSMHVAAVLAVIAVALKSAQLPFHGWLIQVMEAPTPVSALLHAGIVNIGGFVMIRLAPWMAHALAAQLLLVIIGLVTMVVAALVMTTRVSVKVALAWSTCAQVGFMLVECGLGAWHLALLHLVAHSLYKAHSFLSAGGAVEAWRVQEMRARRPRPSSMRLVVVTLGALGAAVACVMVIEARSAAHGGPDLAVRVIALLVGLSVVPLVAGRAVVGVASMAASAASVAVVALLYIGGHSAAARLVPGATMATGTANLGWILVGAGVVVLFAVKAVLALKPGGRFSRALYPWLFAGLYLDERFTRATFRIWPPRLQRPITARAIAVRDPVGGLT